MSRIELTSPWHFFSLDFPHRELLYQARSKTRLDSTREKTESDIDIRLG